MLARAEVDKHSQYRSDEMDLMAIGQPVLQPQTRSNKSYAPGTFVPISPMKSSRRSSNAAKPSQHLATRPSVDTEALPVNVNPSVQMSLPLPSPVRMDSNIDRRSSLHTNRPKIRRSKIRVASKWCEIRGLTSRKKTKRGTNAKKALMGVKSPSRLDVLLGRGGHTNSHEGNVIFRDEVRKMRARYQVARNEEKFGLSQELVSRVEEYGGRFLERGEDFLWYEITDEVLKREKAARSLREKKWD